MENIDQAIQQMLDEMISLRKELHRFPEVGFCEHQTAATVSRYLHQLGFEVQTGIGGTGVIGILRGNSDGPTIALRACLDALAMDEKSGVDYASQNKGVFHGCGHDGNMTFVLGAAKIVSQQKHALRGNIKFIFQPSEEETGGAAEIIRAGGLRNPDVDAIFHLHNWHGIRQGVIAVVPGTVLASSDLFKIEIIGKPGHGAWPHLAVDPILIASDIISGIQTIISREIDPLTPTTITIGKIYGGTAVNIIPKTVTLEGTVRTYDGNTREFIRNRIEEIVKGITYAARAKYEMTYHYVMPPVYNDPQLTSMVQDILLGSFGPQWVINDFNAGMGCEEFSLYQQEVPGVFLFIGNDQERQEMIPLHAPNYLFNDELLPTGIKALYEIVMGFCK